MWEGMEHPSTWRGLMFLVRLSAISSVLSESSSSGGGDAFSGRGDASSEEVVDFLPILL